MIKGKDMAKKTVEVSLKGEVIDTVDVDAETDGEACLEAIEEIVAKGSYTRDQLDGATCKVN